MFNMRTKLRIFFVIKANIEIIHLKTKNFNDVGPYVFMIIKIFKNIP